MLAFVLAFLGLLATGSFAILFLVSQPWVFKTASSPPAVDEAALQAHVRHLSVDLHPRSVDHPGNLNLAADYVYEQMKQAGAEVSVQEFVVESEKFRNIIARFGPKTGPLLVIGAHYDSFGDPDLGAAGYTPGADDNASGVAGLIELARLLARSPQKRPIELVAYTLEEPPHFRTEEMGSAHHARLLKEQGKEVDLMFSLEMIGYFSDAPGSQKYPLPGLSALYPDRGNFIALVGRFGGFGTMRRVKSLMLGASPMPVFSINAPPAVPGIDFSDHLSYWSEGFPAIMVTDTAFARNEAYHRRADTFDRLDYSRMANVVQAVYAVTQGL